MKAYFLPLALIVSVGVLAAGLHSTWRKRQLAVSQSPAPQNMPGNVEQSNPTPQPKSDSLQQPRPRAAANADASAAPAISPISGPTALGRPRHGTPDFPVAPETPNVPAGGVADGGKDTAQFAVTEDVARAALDYVGQDPVAEAVWMDAINDLSMSEASRKNLIEDLNENGLPDPKHPTVNDLPLIDSRIALIENIAPDAIDQVNAAAFAEAYKDLTKMHADLTQPQ